MRFSCFGRNPELLNGILQASSSSRWNDDKRRAAHETVLDAAPADRAALLSGINNAAARSAASLLLRPSGWVNGQPFSVEPATLINAYGR